MAAAIAAARSRLDALAPHLRDVLKSTKPLQEALAMKLDEKRDEARAAALLPSPLLLLYANAHAYADALGVETISVGKIFGFTLTYCIPIYFSIHKKYSSLKLQLNHVFYYFKVYQVMKMKLGVWIN